MTLYEVWWIKEFGLKKKESSSSLGYVSAKGRPYFQICYLFLAVIRTIPIWAPLEQINRERKQHLVLSAALGEQPLRCPGCLFLSHGSPPTALPISLPQLLLLPPNLISCLYWGRPAFCPRIIRTVASIHCLSSHSPSPVTPTTPLGL